MTRSIVRPLAAFALTLAATGGATAQTVTPEFAGDYATVDLGSPPGVPTPLGGLCFSADDPDVLLIGGAANNPAGAIYAVPLERGCYGEVIGFAGEATLHATAPNIDGGLAYGPGGVLFFTQYPINGVGQILPGSTVPDRLIDVTDLGITSSLGTLNFVPAGLPGAGRLKLASYNSSNWYDAAVVPAGKGVYDLVDVTLVTNVAGGPEGLVHIGGENEQFAADSTLVSKYSSGTVAAFEVDAQGDPILETERTMITGLSGAEGAAIDPVTGEFLFSTFGGGNRVIVVRGFVSACPGDVAPAGGDGSVGFDDLLAVLSAWGDTCTATDIDRDGSVAFGDLLLILATWGPCDG